MRWKRNGYRGQNLVEMALTFPFLLIVIFAIMEVGRFWNVYEGARLAAMDGAYTASVYRDTNLGKKQITDRLTRAGIPFNDGNVQVTKAADGTYTVNMQVQYNPLLGGISIASISGPLTIIPNTINITTSNVEANSVY